MREILRSGPARRMTGKKEGKVFNTTHNPFARGTGDSHGDRHARGRFQQTCPRTCPRTRPPWRIEKGARGVTSKLENQTKGKINAPGES